MVDMQKEPDTIISPTDALANELKLEATTNDTNQNQFLGGDMVDLLGNGVPGYETTGVDGSDDDVENQLSIKPKPPNTW